MPGDLVQFKVQKRGRRGFRIIPEHIERAAAYPPEIGQATPFCEYYGHCGGCRGQHLDYKTQLSLKAGPIMDEMESLYGLRPELMEAPDTRDYRNRMDFVVNGGPEKEAVIGLRPVGDFSSFVDLKSCSIQREAANQLLSMVRTLLARYPEAAFSRNFTESPADRSQDGKTEGSPGSGGPLKYVTIRSGYHSGVVSLTIAPELLDSAGGRSYVELRESLSMGVEELGFSLLECEAEIQSEISNVPGGRVLTGRADYTERLGGLDFEVPYDSFFQPNPPAFDRLLEWCRARLEELEAPEKPKEGNENGGEELLDLYSGAGVLSAVLANYFPDRFKRIRGYDFVESSVARSATNLSFFKERGGELDFQAIDLNKPPEDLFEGFKGLVVMDPPRAGISPKLIKALRKKCEAPYVLYISCNPKSQLQNLAAMKGAYVPVAGCIMDCYPQTPHLEQALLLRRAADRGGGAGES